MSAVDGRTGITHCGRERAPSWRTGGGDGCQWWEREPGIDDDDWDPPGTPVIARYKPDTPPAPRHQRGRDGWWTAPRRQRRPAPVQKVIPIVVPQRDPFGGMFNWNED